MQAAQTSHQLDVKMNGDDKIQLIPESSKEQKISDAFRFSYISVAVFAILGNTLVIIFILKQIEEQILLSCFTPRDL